MQITCHIFLNFLFYFLESVLSLVVFINAIMFKGRGANWPNSVPFCFVLFVCLFLFLGNLFHLRKSQFFGMCRTFVFSCMKVHDLETYFELKHSAFCQVTVFFKKTTTFFFTSMSSWKQNSNNQQKMWVYILRPTLGPVQNWN